MNKPEDYTDVFIEIGFKGFLTGPRALAAINRLYVMLDTMPDTRFCLMVGGFDNDPREVWDIPEVKRYYRMIAEGLALSGKPFMDLNLHDDTMAVFALCTETGRIVAKHDAGYTVDIGQNEH
jgi:hypothetical protein